MIEYRLATPEDLPAICILGETVNAMHHAHSPLIFAEPGDPMVHANEWSQYLGRKEKATIVAIADGKMVGFVNGILATSDNSLLTPIKYCRVASLAVESDYQRQGIGRELMQQMENWALANGAKDFRLNVWLFNQSAIALYETLGLTQRSVNMGKPLGQSDA